MGQTLTHGVYLPAEGERNCYDGLASNWNILDGAVGTIAEHTTALAGKAPAVHTHTKSDVTDLLNSNFIPSVNNSYDLGSSSYQWNNIYSKGYYYNGVAWGLDKTNVWTGNNEFNTNFVTVKKYRLRVKEYEMVLGTVPSSNQWTGFQFVDKNDTSISEIAQSFQSNGNVLYQINVFPNEANSVKRSVIAYTYNSASNINAVTFTSHVLPTSNNALELGTSTNKWKSLNGVNPGALSLPSMSYISLDTTGFDVTATTIGTFTPTMDGWAILSVTQKNKPFGIWILLGSYRVTFQSVYHDGNYLIFALIPVWTNLNLTIYCTADDIDSTRKVDWLRLFPCQGNV